MSVPDGDIVTVLDATKRQHKVRVTGIDAPEKAQAFGDESRQNLAAITFKRVVEIVGHKRDRYGLLLGKVMVGDPNCNHAQCPKIHDARLMQIMSELAWHYEHYEKEQSDRERADCSAAEERSLALA